MSIPQNQINLAFDYVLVGFSSHSPEEIKYINNNLANRVKEEDMKDF